MITSATYTALEPISLYPPKVIIGVQNTTQNIYTFRSLPGVALRASTLNLPSALYSSFTTYRFEEEFTFVFFLTYFHPRLHPPGSRRGCRGPCVPRQTQHSRRPGRGRFPEWCHSAWPVEWWRRHAYFPRDQHASSEQDCLREESKQHN